MSEVEAHFVKRGLWTKLDDGPIVGKTITADVQAGTIVVALLAVLASMGTAHLWNLVAFLVHQLRADGTPADGLFRQQQVLLRTLPTPSSLLADTTKLWLFWKSRTDRALTRSLIPLSLGLFFWIGTVVVGVLSSYIVASDGLEVLVKSPLCGALNIDSTVENYTDNAYDLRTYEAKVAALSKSYADDCYNSGSTLSTRCGVFTRPSIPFTKQRAQCPFNSSICADVDKPAMKFDSGLVDINDAFGMNLATKDRVKFRRQTNCAILRTEGRSSIAHASDYPELDHAPFPGEELLVMHYGDIVYDTTWPNATFLKSLAVSNVTYDYKGMYQTAYKNPSWWDMNDFDPISEMKQGDWDIVIFMLSTGIMGYGSPVDDPFFAAHRSQDVSTVRGSDETWYLSDFPVSMMGCAQQYQLCYRKGSQDNCTDLTALPPSPTPEEYPGASDIQLAAMQLLIRSSLLFDISDAGQDVLKATDMAGGVGFIPSLPDDQWIQELIGWEEFVWAALQIAISDYAIGPTVRDPSAGLHMRNETTKGERELCKVQRMRKAGGFVSINAFGLALIAVFSCLVAIVDFMVLRFMVFLSRFRKAMAPRLDRWIHDGVFQLQRRAYEAVGQGTWHDIDREIPVTSSKEKLGELPVASASAARLSEASVECCDCKMKKLRTMKSWATDKTATSSSASSVSGKQARVIEYPLAT